MKTPVSASLRSDLFQWFLQRAKGVLHLGAHLGTEAKLYAKQKKTVLWVEAAPHTYSMLAKRLERYPSQRAFCALLGDRDGLQTTFYISNNSAGVSSSIFQFGEYGSGDQSLWPEEKLGMVDSLTLPMIRLDTLLRDNGVDVSQYDFWVVDLQGAELLALKGAGDLLQQCRAALVEVSTVEVYQGGVLWPDLQQFLANAGFVPLWDPAGPHDDVLFVRAAQDHDLRN